MDLGLLRLSISSWMCVTHLLTALRISSHIGLNPYCGLQGPVWSGLAHLSNLIYMPPSLCSLCPSHIGLLVIPRFGQALPQLKALILPFPLSGMLFHRHFACLLVCFSFSFPRSQIMCQGGLPWPLHPGQGLLDTLSHEILFTSFIIYNHTMSLFCLLIVISLRAGILSILFTALSPASSIGPGTNEMFNYYFF